jgi:hypothetical protein
MMVTFAKENLALTTLVWQRLQLKLTQEKHALKTLIVIQEAALMTKNAKELP